MIKSTEQLQAALDREIEYSKRLNEKVDRMREQLKSFVSIAEHQKVIAELKRKHEAELAEIKNQQSCKHNERGAGRKKKATPQVVMRVLELRKVGLSQAKIAAAVSLESGVIISRTTVGEIVRGKHGNGYEVGKFPQRT